MRQTFGPSFAALSVALLLPIQCLAQSTPSFDSAAQAFATPTHCLVLDGRTLQGDGLPASYAADMVTAMNAGNAAGMTNEAVVTAIRKVCAEKTDHKKT